MYVKSKFFYNLKFIVTVLFLKNIKKYFFQKLIAEDNPDGKLILDEKPQVEKKLNKCISI